LVLEGDKNLNVLVVECAILEEGKKRNRATICLSLPSPAGLSAVFIKHCVTLLLLFPPPFFSQHLQERDRHMQIVFLTAERISSKIGKTISPWQQMSLINTAKDGNFGLFCGYKSETAQGPFQWRFQFQINNY
jgi:hypothetical protein